MQAQAPQPSIQTDADRARIRANREAALARRALWRERAAREEAAEQQIRVGSPGLRDAEVLERVEHAVGDRGDEVDHDFPEESD